VGAYVLNTPPVRFGGRAEAAARRLLFFLERFGRFCALLRPVQTNVYVDGFNLYYGCLKQTAHRWLDLGALAHALLPKHGFHRIRYFTALVSTIPGDGDGRQPLRQQTYIRALETISALSVHYGHYLSHPTRMPLARPTSTSGKFAEVIKTEEKGSDVNLATMLLLDAFKRDFEQAVIITNDSDLALPIELAREELKLPVGVIFPCTRPGRQASARLRKVATFTRDIRETTLRACQFPLALTDARGKITKPPTW
jgi:NYN domain